MIPTALLFCVVALASVAQAFVSNSDSRQLQQLQYLQQQHNHHPPPPHHHHYYQRKLTIQKLSSSSAAADEDLVLQKKRLLSLLGKFSTKDAVLADPITKEAVEITAPGVVFGGESRRRSNVQYKIESPSNSFRGSSDSFLDLLEPIPTKATKDNNDENENDNNAPLTVVAGILQRAAPIVPFFLRQPLASLSDGEYVPMRDLFTSPSVAFAYERGWRQGFAQAGFPGPDVESRMAMDYFAPVVSKAGGQGAGAGGSAQNSVVVDMSCATGLFTRRFASTDTYGRVLGCDYSEAMLTEARRRINEEPKLSKNALKTTKLDLVRLDVGQIPMQDSSIDCLHAGAAMHCWPDLDAAASEIYRVLKPGGRYFATTFLSRYFSVLSSTDGQDTPVSQQAFQYFESVETLRSLLERGGFESDKIAIEILGTACVVIKAEK